MTLEELMKEFAQKSYSELVQIGREGINQAFPQVKALINEVYDGDENMLRVFLLGLIGSCIGIDNSLSTLEVQYLNDTMGLQFSADDYKNLAISALDDAEFVDAIDNLVDSLDKDSKFAIARFCLCLFAVDKSIERNEIAYLAKLLN